MDVTQAEYRISRRSLMLRDSVAFVTLILLTVVLFIVTLFLFRSFSAHRGELAQRWYARGTAALAANRAEDAVSALRTALSYAPAERIYQLSLAEVLEQAGKTDEAFAYFSNLWESEPGNGLLNLQLARLSAKKQDAEEQRLENQGRRKGILKAGSLERESQEKQDQEDAIRYYHASIYGTWEGNGMERRRDVRLELVRYLLAHKNPGAARNELLIASGNYGDDPGLEMQAAPLMFKAGDAASALEMYERVLKVKTDDLSALEGAAETAFKLGRYATAQRYTRKARKVAEANDNRAALQRIHALLGETDRILALYPAGGLPVGERVVRIMQARALAKDRINVCEQPTGGDIPGGSAPETTYQEIEDWWKQDDKDKVVEAAMRTDASLQRAEMQLIYKTEIALSQLCGTPNGDDALLLLIAKSPEKVEQ